ncbi:PAS domain S-box protein [Qipengyuania sediminis]|uniref:PAS domain S-box protein n=1 Tax=Qipengyuania sediminis TaxID=1532023 RepID=UPI001404D460|nr:PAS domain S-box protein [Qipengyuania sediminis]
MEDSDSWRLTGRIQHELGRGDPFAAAVRATRMPMVITDPHQDDNPIIFANDAFLRLTGYARGEVLGRNCRFLQGEGTDPRSVRAVQEAIAEKRDIAIELLNYRKDGSTFHNALYLSPVLNEAGEIQFYFASQMDVSEQVVARTELHRNETELRLIVEGASDYAVIATDPERRVTNWSAGAERAFGWTAEEMIGESADVIFLPQDRQAGQPEKEARDAVARGYANDERWHQRKDGGQVFMNGAMHPLPLDANGQPQGFLKIARDETERRQAHEARREIEERYRIAAQATNDAIWDWRIADGQVIWNEALGDLFGHRLGETSADWWLAQIHPEDRARIDRDIHAVIGTNGKAWSAEYRFRRADGSYAFVYDRGQVLRDADGQPVRMIGAMLDLTERKAAEAELVRTNTLLKGVMEAVPGVVYAKDELGRITSANRGTAELIGKPLAEIIGHTDDQYLADKDQAAAVMANDRRIMASGRTEVIEEIVNGADGTPLVWLSTKAPLRDSDGNVVGLIGASIDITQRKDAERRLKELNDTLETQVAERTAERDRMWESSADLMVVVDFDGFIRRINPAWTARLGLTAGEVVNRHLREVVVGEDMADSLSALMETIEGRPAVVENRLRHKDGSERWFAWSAAPGNGVAYATGRDITAEKEAAAELEQAQEALRQAQKMEAVGQLTGGLAHDFNNLLAGISGSLELMATRMAQGRVDEIERYLIAAQGAAKRAAALTHRLLAFSRRQTLDPKPTNIGALVAGMEDMVRRTVGPAISVESVAGGGVWSVLVDPNQLENALLNLCINARDAMPEGGKITIETSNRWLDERAAKALDLPAGQFVSLCVSDNGAGMSPDVVSKAFDPFFTTKPIGMGTGLGLSMIYGFARQSGGQVRIYSEAGKGTMVCIYLPRHHGESDGAPQSDAALPGPATLSGGGTVLVIDDEPLVRMLVVDALGDLGYDAVEAEDGPTGLKVLRSEQAIDLLITDVGLPNGMNGRQVADAARELRPGLKVLFITGFAENAVLNHGHLDHGMQVLTKPFAVSDLGERITAMMEQR